MRILLFLLIGHMGMAVDFSDFSSYQEKVSRRTLEEKLRIFLKKDPRIEGYFELKEEELNVYTALPGQEERALEYCLKLCPEEEHSTTSMATKESLSAVRIAIDPGHFGGRFCRLEERYIDIPPGLGRETSLQFDEGTLSYLTAIHLKDLLEKEGAIVFLTRKSIGEGALSLDFFDWLKENPQIWKPETTLQKLFKQYNQLDLYARCAKINAFCPDLTIVIHFNAQPGRDGLSSNSSVSPTNFNMVFVPGAFSASELMDPENRYEFMRLLVTEDLYHSLDLSRSILAKLIENLHIPAVTSQDGARYLDIVCLKIEEGIYSRNLTLTRLIHSPVCYVEALVQNNIDESLNLSRQDDVIGGIPCSSRIKEAAQGCYEGIQNYLKIPLCSRISCPEDFD